MTIRDVLRVLGYRAIRQAEAHKQKEFKMNTTKTSKVAAVNSAAWYLRRHDFLILDTNWHCNDGTIDIVATEDDNLVIVEVKPVDSKNGAFAPESKPTAEQRSNLENMAFDYLFCHDISDMPLRFDTVEIKKIDDDRCMIKHHVNALGIA